jgi:hypothetical protein
MRVRCIGIFVDVVQHLTPRSVLQTAQSPIYYPQSFYPGFGVSRLLCLFSWGVLLSKKHPVINSFSCFNFFFSQ